MHELTKLIKDDMRPALGVTEPGAIAYAVSKARSYLTGELKEVRLLLNSGMYKNAYTCEIPNSLFFGNEYDMVIDNHPTKRSFFSWSCRNPGKCTSKPYIG